MMHGLPKRVLSAFLFTIIAIHATALANSSLTSQLAQTSTTSSVVFKATLGSSNLTFQSSNYAMANLTNASSSHADIMTTQMNAGTTAPFNVWPKDGTDQSGNKAILGKITDVTGLSLDEINVSQLGSDLSFVNFFIANMTRNAAFRVGNTTEVLTVTLKGTGAAAVDFDSGGIEDDDQGTGNATFHHAKRDTSYTVKSNQEPEMVYISQPRNVEGGWLLGALGGQYVYPKSAGRGALLYVIDSGADDTNPEFDDIRTTWRWAGPNFDRSANGGNYPDPVIGDYASSPHGTGVLSKAAGAAYGVAKYPYVIIVRRATKLFIEDAIDRITWVIQDWLSERDSANVKVATINISWAFESTKIKDEEKLKLPQFQSLFVRAIQEGILPICAAGNHPGDVSSYPAKFPSPYDWEGVPRQPPASRMMVIGATNIAGRYSRHSCRAPWVQLTAPAVNIMTADYKKAPDPNIRKFGTSYASPQVAGLATVIAAQGDYADVVQGSWEAGVTILRQEIMSLAYSRAPPGSRVGVAIWPLGIWNGVRTVNGKCGTWVPPTRKRDATTPDECSINTSLTSSTAITAQTSTIPPLPASTGRLGGQIFTNITVAPSSIILGFNRTSMLKAIVSKLREMCDPANTVCTEYGEIDNVYSFFANTVTKGTLNVKIPESSYNNKTRAQRDGLVLRAGQAMSASGSNCATHLEEIGNCPERREVGDASACEVTHVDVCHYTDSVDVVVFQDDVGLIAQMQIEFSFDFPGEALLCEDIVAAIDIDTALIALFPELTAPLVEIREALGEEEAWCNDINKILTQASAGA